MSPQRIQRRRTKGWRMPEGAVYVGRGSKWGNQFIVGQVQLRFPREDGRESWEYEGRLYKTSGERHAFHHGDGTVTWHEVRDANREECVALYREYVTGETDMLDWRSRPVDLAPLRGRDLACWCPLEDEHGNHVPCHADVLLDLANREVP